jgi:Dynamin GTPase effector domain
MLDEDPSLMEKRDQIVKRLELYKSARNEIDSVAWKWFFFCNSEAAIHHRIYMQHFVYTFDPFFYFFQLNWDRKWDAQVPASCFLLRWCKSGTIDSLEKGKAHGWFLIILFSHMICSCIIVCSFNKYIGQYSYTGGLVTDSLFHYQHGKKKWRLNWWFLSKCFSIWDTV